MKLFRRKSPECQHDWTLKQSEPVLTGIERHELEAKQEAELARQRAEAERIAAINAKIAEIEAKIRPELEQLKDLWRQRTLYRDGYHPSLAGGVTGLQALGGLYSSQAQYNNNLAASFLGAAFPIW